MLPLHQAATRRGYRPQDKGLSAGSASVARRRRRPSAIICRAWARSSERPTLRAPATRSSFRYQTENSPLSRSPRQTSLVPLVGGADVLEAGPVGEVAEEVGDDLVVARRRRACCRRRGCPAASPRPSARPGSGGRGRRSRRSSSRRRRRCPATEVCSFESQTIAVADLDPRPLGEHRVRLDPGADHDRVALDASPLLVDDRLDPAVALEGAQLLAAVEGDARWTPAAAGTSARRPRRRSARGRRPPSPRSCTWCPRAVSEAATSLPM